MNPFYFWLSLLLISMLAVPDSKEQRGYIWRVVRKIPPWRYIRGSSHDARFARFMLLAIFSAVFWHSVGLRGDRPWQATYATLIVLYVDDYVNGGDDDHRKLYEWARNKIKWKMALPAPQPVRGDTA